MEILNKSKTVLSDGRVKIEFAITIINECVFPSDDAVLITNYVQQLSDKYSPMETSIPTIVPVIMSKLLIRRNLRALGLEEALDAILSSSIQAQRDWDDAIEISTADPLFLQFKEVFKTNFNVSDETLNNLIDMSKK